MWVYSSLENKVTFIIGSAKNAGKTTFMNFAARCLRTRGRVALISIGIDGERQDLVFGTPKPLIPIDEGDVVVTSESALADGGAIFAVRAVMPFRTVLGRIVIAEARRAGFVELVGPETNSQLSDIIALVTGECGVKTVLVDGAANRLTQVSSSVQSGIIDVVKVTPGNASRMVERIRTLSMLTRAPLVPAYYASSSALPEGWEEIPGALTSEKLLQRGERPLPTKGLIVHDFSRVFLSWSELRTLQTQLFVREQFELRAVVINAQNIDDKEFVAKLRDDPIAQRIIISPYKDLLT